jgi:hypothetical protein
MEKTWFSCKAYITYNQKEGNITNPFLILFLINATLGIEWFWPTMKASEKPLWLYRIYILAITHSELHPP